MGELDKNRGWKKNDSFACAYEEESESMESSSSSEIAAEEEDGSSSSSTSSSNGPLFQLSDLMDQLPIKRGLSKYYNGKSQSHASLGGVKSLEDLAKRENPFRKRMKSSKSYGGVFELDGHRYGPKATIAKKGSRVSFLSSLGKRSTFGTPNYVHHLKRDL